MAQLLRILAVSGHKFWADDLPPNKAAAFSSVAVVGHRQVIDAYLLALATANGGRLVTFDRGIGIGAVAGAAKRNLLVLG